MKSDPPELPIISAIILAAGASRRMGLPKMLLPWGKTVVIEKVVFTLLEGGISQPVIVAGRSADEIRKILPVGSVIWAHNPAFETTEMLQSLQIGLRSLPESASAFMIVLGDQPQIESAVIRQLIAEFTANRQKIIIPSYRFRRGHPWLVSTQLLPDLLALPEDATLRHFLNTHAELISYLNVDSSSVLMDLDTPAEYEQQKPACTGKLDEH